MSRVRAIARLLLPPVVVAAARRLRDAASRPPGPPEWEYVADEWPVRDTRAAGWLHDSVAATQRSKWAAFERSLGGSAPLGSAHEARDPSRPDYGAHNTIMSFAYVLARAARGRDRLSVLDWGGGLGHYAAIARAALPELTLDYVVHDLPALCAAAGELCRHATFSADEPATFARPYDLVFASASLQYAPDWRAQMASLAAVASDWFYLTRLPIVASAPSFVVVQRPAAHGYLTEYIGWVLNRSELEAHAGSCGLVLEREFLVAERPLIAGAPEQCEYRGFLFRRITG